MNYLIFLEHKKTLDVMCTWNKTFVFGNHDKDENCYDQFCTDVNTTLMYW